MMSDCYNKFSVKYVFSFVNEPQRRASPKLPTLRGCLHDTGMTFILQRVHSIPIYFSTSVTWYRVKISFRHKSFWNEFIPVFNPNEILVQVWNFILVSYKVKTKSFWNENRKPCSLGRVAHAYRCQGGGERSIDCVIRCSTNLVQERNSFRNESHSRIMWIAPKFSYFHLKLNTGMHYIFSLILRRIGALNRSRKLRNSKVKYKFFF